jgi:drug/metabolite transporter (DMT)-like permease
VKDDHYRGSGLMIAAMLILPFNDAIAKHLSAQYPVVEIVWARFAFHFAILLPIVWLRHGPAALKTEQIATQIVRSGFMLLTVLLFFFAISTIPLADAMALLLTAPILVTALSPVLLGEHVGVRRWIAVSVGFAGAMILIRPGFATLQWGSILALCAGLSHALFNLFTRKLSGAAPPLVTLTYTAILGVAGMSLVVPFQWITPAGADILLMAGIGLFAVAGHFLLIRAFDHAPASSLAPLLYTELIAATAIGYMWFGDMPDAWTWLGMAVITFSGVYIAIRERRLGHQ